MEINRRTFVVLGCAMAAGCAAENAPIHLHPVLINAGAASEYAADGVYDRFKSLGFFVVRQGMELKVLSSVCTHRSCRLRAEQDHTFYCKCHGSTFDPSGKVTEGPATMDLPRLPFNIDESGQLWIRAVAR